MTRGTQVLILLVTLLSPACKCWCFAAKVCAQCLISRVTGHVTRVPHGPGSIPILSFTASLNRCLQPRYFSVVWTETCPKRN